LSRLFPSFAFCQELRFHLHVSFRIVVYSSILIVSDFSLLSLDSYLRMQAIKMSNELHHCASIGDMSSVTELVESGANIDETDEDGKTALLLASEEDHGDIVLYLVERGANVAHTDGRGMTALHYSVAEGEDILTMRYLLEVGASVAERSDNGMTVLLHAAAHGNLEAVQYLLSPEGGASMSESDYAGHTALLRAAGVDIMCQPTMVQWFLEYGGAQITDRNNDGKSVWTVHGPDGLPDLLKCTYMKRYNETFVTFDGEYIPAENTEKVTTMLRVMVLHGGPPESLTADLAPPLQRIVEDGARLRARLPAYLTQRRALLDAHCPLLPPLQAIVHGYEEPTTTDELWATGLGEPLQGVKRPELVTCQLPQRGHPRRRQKRL
jgi:hypothetical protein